MEISIKHHSSPDPEVLALLASLDAGIFESPMSADDFSKVLRQRHNLCVLIAMGGETPCGYKVGYELYPDVFFSFSGGVLPHARRQGIATALADEQHRFAKGRGYKVVRIHTKNKYREMLTLSIKSGFDVTGVNHATGERAAAIILEKSLE